MIKLTDDSVVSFGKSGGIAASVSSDTRKLLDLNDNAITAALDALHRRQAHATIAFGRTRKNGSITVVSQDLPNHVDLFTKEQVVEEARRRKLVK